MIPKQHKPLFFVTLLCLLAGIVVRFVGLGAVPHGLAWDEAAIGYNGFAIVETRRDEWLQRLPISFRSFGDYKAPLAIYINGLSTAIFDLSPFAVRLPFAVAGILSILFIALIAGELWRETSHRHWAFCVAVALVFSTPWHMHYSRVAFESGLALLLTSIAVYSFLRVVVDQRITRQFVWMGCSSLCAVLSLYAYHSAKIAVPLLFFGLTVLYQVQLRKRKWVVLFGVTSALLFSYPLLKDSIAGQGLTRANVTVFSQVNSIPEAARVITQQFALHLQPGFLVLGQTTTLRHGDGEWGVLLPTTYVLALFALGFTALSFFKPAIPGLRLMLNNRRMLVALWWICVGILPAAIATEVPHSNRALLALPGFIFLAIEGAIALGMFLQTSAVNQRLIGSRGEQNLLPKSVLGSLFMIHILVSIVYINHYFTSYAAASTAAFSDGYIEAFSIAKEYERGLNNRPEVSTILFSDEYGQPYIYALFVRKTDPQYYQGGSLIKYQFATITAGDLLRENTLVVATPANKLPLEKADHVVLGSDGSVRFALYHTPK